MSVYTVRVFAANSGSTGLHTAYTVPSGKTFVMRSVDATWTASTYGYLVVGLGSALGVIAHNFSGHFENFNWAGRMSFSAGETIVYACDVTNGVNFQVTGYLFPA